MAERSSAISPSREFGIKYKRIHAEASQDFLDINQLLGMGVGQGSKKDAIDDREDSSGSANAESER